MTPKKPSAEEQDQKSPTESQRAENEKRNYKKPAFRSERVFETMALNCGKIAIQGQCRHKRRAS
jgi:hypothetical protein